MAENLVEQCHYLYNKSGATRYMNAPFRKSCVKKGSYAATMTKNWGCPDLNRDRKVPNLEG